MKLPYSALLAASLLTTGLLVNVASAVKPGETPEALARGKAIYTRTCIWCHGIQGKGDGPAALFIGAYTGPRPKDFTREDYKFRSTASGQLPTDEDLFRTLTKGIPGFMPSFQSFTEQERWAVIAYIKTFAPGFQENGGTAITLPDPPITASPESISRGRSVYVEQKCEACHGLDGKGDGPLALARELTDTRGMALAATDLTRPRSFKNGTMPQDIIRTLLTGLNGTPMPSYEAAFEDHQEDLWHLANYLLSLSAPLP